MVPGGVANLLETHTPDPSAISLVLHKCLGNEIAKLSPLDGSSQLLHSKCARSSTKKLMLDIPLITIELSVLSPLLTIPVYHD